MKTDFQASATFAAYVVSLQRLRDAYADLSLVIGKNPLPSPVNERRREEEARKLTLRLARATMTATVFSIAEEAIIQLAGSEALSDEVVRARFGIHNNCNVSAFQRVRARLEVKNPNFSSATWDKTWDWFSDLRKVRNKLTHQGGVQEPDEGAKLLSKLGDDGFWLEPIFPESGEDIQVVIIGDLRFRSLISELITLVMAVDETINVGRNLSLDRSSALAN